MLGARLARATALPGRYRWGLAVFVLCAGAALVFYLEALGDTSERAITAMNAESQELIDAIDDGLVSAEDRLTALQGFFQAREQVTREEFARFAARIGGGVGVEALGFAPLVDHAALPSFEEELRADLPAAFLHDLSRDPLTPRARYFPILYQVRFGAGGGDAMGAILNSDRGVREAILRAIQLDRPVLSAFRSARGGDRAMLVAPVQGGVVYSTIRVDSFYGSSPGTSRAVIRDVTDSPHLWIDEPQIQSPTLWRDTIRLYSRRWQVETSRQTPHFALERAQLGVALVLALTVSLLAAVATQLVVDRTAASNELARLLHLATEKDRFLASVSHELRTPLTAIVGMSSILAEDRSSLSEDDVQEMTEAVQQEAQELADLVEDLLTVGRLHADALNIFPEDVDLDEEIGRVVERLQAPEGVALEVRPELGRVWADPLRVRQIIRNLAVNALKYATSHVEISTHHGDGAMLIEVANDGDPIPPERLPHIFQPYQGRDTSARQPTSIGLGLSISRQLARAMDGDIDYRHVEGRTVFTVALPPAVPAGVEPPSRVVAAS